MLLLIVAGIARASDEVSPEPPFAEGPSSEVAPASMGASRGGGSSSSSSSGKKKKDSSNGNANGSGGKTYDKGKILGWGYRPYVTPGGGVAIGDGGASVSAGAEVGVKYWKNWKGDLSVGASYTTGDTLNGYDVHAGNEFGRREKYWGLTAGLIGFYNGYTAKDGSQALDPSLGLDVPVEITAGPRNYYAYGTIVPSFLFNEERRVESLPFGDELEWGVGAGINLKWVTAELGFNQRITSVGVINTPTLTLSIAGLE